MRTLKSALQTATPGGASLRATHTQLTDRHVCGDAGGAGCQGQGLRWQVHRRAILLLRKGAHPPCPANWIEFPNNATHAVTQTCCQSLDCLAFEGNFCGPRSPRISLRSPRTCSLPWTMHRTMHRRPRRGRPPSASASGLIPARQADQRGCEEDTFSETGTRSQYNR
jgi:hypothetical protein